MSVISQLLGNDNKLASPASVATHVGDFGGVDLSDVAQGIAELEQDFRDISDVENYADQCEMMANFAESTLADRGMNRQTAALFNAVLGQTEDRLGIMNTNLGTESFGDADSAVRATELGCENLQVKAKAVWDTIKKAILAIRDKIMKIVRNFMDKIPGLIKKFKSLMERADKTTDPIREKKIELAAGTIAQLHIDNKLDAKVLKDGITLLGESTVATYDASKAYVKARLDLINTSSENIADYVVFVSGLPTGGDKYDDPESGDKRINVSEDQEVKRGPQLPGGRAEFVVITKDATINKLKLDKSNIEGLIVNGEVTEEGKIKIDNLSKLVKLRTKEKAVLQSYVAKPKDVDSKDVETLAAATISDLADDIIDFLEDMKKLSKFQADVDKSSREQIKKAEGMLKELEDNDDNKATAPFRKLGRAVVNEVSKMGGKIDTHAIKMVSMFATTSGAVYDYCSKSLAEHKA